MTRTRQILTGVGTLACAAGIGFVMQGSDSADKRYGASDPALQSNEMLNVEDIMLTSGDLGLASDIQPLEIPSTDAQVTKASAPQTLLSPQDHETPVVPACEMISDARPIAAAMVKLTLNASCLPNERVTVHHNGMIFSQVTSDIGKLEITVPALAEEAVFIMAFSNGEGAVAQTKVEELADFDRMVLQWKGDSGFEIHAREFGADYGGVGHVWSGAPGEIANAVTGEGGFMTRLGDITTPEALLAEVYTYPVAATERSGDIDLTVEAEVTNVNCGLEIEAQALEVLTGGEMKTRNLTLSVPECDAAGNFLVLNNLLQDLKVAAN